MLNANLKRVSLLILSSEKVSLGIDYSMWFTKQCLVIHLISFSELRVFGKTHSNHSNHLKDLNDIQKNVGQNLSIARTFADQFSTDSEQSHQFHSPKQQHRFQAQQNNVRMLNHLFDRTLRRNQILFSVQR